MSSPSLGKRSLAEFIGTFWLVFAGCGAAVMTAGIPNVGIGLFGVGLAFGLAVLTMAYAIGHISGCHLNPAVSLGLCVGRRFPARDLLPYIVAQLFGAVVGASLLFIIFKGQTKFPIGGFACNGYAEHSPDGYSMTAGLISEIILTFMFLLIIMGATDRRAPQGFAPLAIGLGLTLMHLTGIRVTNLSLNPARSTATAIFVGDWAIKQLWMFWLAPIVGGMLGGFVYARLGDPDVESPISPLEKLAQQSEARAASAEGA